jgi:cytochrome c-type biogenesis protein CcmF
MLPSIGHLFLLLAFACAIYGIAITFAAYHLPQERRQACLTSAFNASLAIWWLVVAASGLLIYLFLSDDFSVSYVWAHSSIAQPIQFKVSAMWAGQSGSLLLWTLMLAGYGALIAVAGKRHEVGGDKLLVQLAPTSAAVIHGINLLFLGLVCFVTNPFEVSGPAPDGSGMNPLLQNYWMQIHPPTLYLGYVGCSVPFAWAAAALIHRQFGKDWVALVRRWTLIPWLILGVGIIMGGAWAYETLGWGGYWAWDPVENASLLPWLTATAFLHSIMIQARRGMLKNWNMVLVSLTFLLSVFGTFLTRSGVVASVHSFAESNIGGYFLAFLGVALVLSFGLIIWRREQLASEFTFESVFSREGAFMLNNWILLGSAFAVLWGTIYPALREAIDGQSVSVGAPYFNKVMVPLGLLLLGLTGIGPLMAWRRTTPAALLRTAKWPIVGALVMAPLLYFLSAWHTGAATAFCLSAFVAVGIILEFVRGTRARMSMTNESAGTAFSNLFLRNRRRYGGYIVHLGIALLFAGFAGSSGFKIETEPITLGKGDKMQVGEYALRFDGFVQAAEKGPDGKMVPVPLSAEKEKEINAQVSVFLMPKEKVTPQTPPLTQLVPRIDIFKLGGNVPEEARAGQAPESARRPAIMSNMANDLYLALIDANEEEQKASIKAYLNPLVMWIWISMAFFIIGTIIAIWPDRRGALRAEAQAKEATPRQAAATNREKAPVAAMNTQENA